jgi:hypothetical protein
MDTMPIDQCPEIWNAKRISVFHSTRAVFCAPSDPSGVGSMYRQVIRSTPLWKHGGIAAPQRDCMFVAKGSSSDSESDSLAKDVLEQGFQDLIITRVYLLFLFQLDDIDYPYALVHWFNMYGEEQDPNTGMWIVQPRYNKLRSQDVLVIHIDTVLHRAHLLPVFGQDRAIQDLHGMVYTQTLDNFQAFYVNKYIDHHAFEIAF